MSSRVGAFSKARKPRELEDRHLLNESDHAMLQAADQIERAASDLKILNAVLNRVEKNVTAAAKRAVKQGGRWPLRLNSRKAKRK